MNLKLLKVDDQQIIKFKRKSVYWVKIEREELLIEFYQYPIQ